MDGQMDAWADGRIDDKQMDGISGIISQSKTERLNILQLMKIRTGKGNGKAMQKPGNNHSEKRSLFC